jgi:AcrR family transcriptional regulator
MAVKLNKGELTKQSLLIGARTVFNQHGLLLTLNELAKRLNVSVSKISNHFPTKEHLFVEMSKEYDRELDVLMQKFDWQDKVDFQKLYELIGQIMTFQENYRSLLIYACSAGLNKNIFSHQVTESWNKRLKGLDELFELLVGAGLLQKDLLEKNKNEILRIHFVNLLTTWLVSYTLYEKGKPVKATKVLYQKTVLHCFADFSTVKGKSQILSILNSNT